MDPRFDQKKIMDAIEMAAAKTGSDAQKLKGAASRGDFNQILASLNKQDAAKLNQLLSDKAATEKLLSSPQAQQLLKALMKDGKM